MKKRPGFAHFYLKIERERERKKERKKERKRER